MWFTDAFFATRILKDIHINSIFTLILRLYSKYTQISRTYFSLSPNHLETKSADDTEKKVEFFWNSPNNVSLWDQRKKLLINIFANIHVTCNKCWSLLLMVPNINVFKLTVLLDFSIIRFTRTTYIKTYNCTITAIDTIKIYILIPFLLWFFDFTVSTLKYQGLTFHFLLTI
jgi:hypothetical protein